MLRFISLFLLIAGALSAQAKINYVMLGDTISKIVCEGCNALPPDQNDETSPGTVIVETNGTWSFTRRTPIAWSGDITFSDGNTVTYTLSPFSITGTTTDALCYPLNNTCESEGSCSWSINIGFQLTIDPDPNMAYIPSAIAVQTSVGVIGLSQSGPATLGQNGTTNLQKLYRYR